MDGGIPKRAQIQHAHLFIYISFSIVLSSPQAVSSPYFVIDVRVYSVVPRRFSEASDRQLSASNFHVQRQCYNTPYKYDVLIQT